MQYFLSFLLFLSSFYGVQANPAPEQQTYQVSRYLPQTLNVDSARQSTEEDRLGKVAANPNSKLEADGGITLYYSPQCPYCQKVLSYMRQSGIQIPMKNVKADKAARDELVQRGGYLVVPCLIVDGRPIYDANDIIAWLSAHQSLLKNSSL